MRSAFTRAELRALGVAPDAADRYVRASHWIRCHVLDVKVIATLHLLGRITWQEVQHMLARRQVMYSHKVTFTAQGQDGEPQMEVAFTQYYKDKAVQLREQEPFLTKMLGAVMEHSQEHKQRDGA